MYSPSPMNYIENMSQRLAGLPPKMAVLRCEDAVVAKGILITKLPFEMGLEGEN